METNPGRRGSKDHKEVKKQDEKRIWDITEIFKVRGYTAEETANYIDILPS